MAGNHKDRTAQGANKKAENQNRAPSQGAPREAGTAQATAPQPAPKKATGRKKAAAKRTPGKASPKRRISEEERYHMIQEAAYFQAEKRGFSCDPWKCWLDAEAEIDARLTRPR
jgi:hypothetical protein